MPERRDSSQPVSRVLYPPKRAVIISLGRRLPDASSNLPGTASGTGRPIVPAWFCSRWGLPGRLCHHRRRCALTAPFHPHPACLRMGALYLSVALAVGSPRLAVSQHRALWSADFPHLAQGETRSPGQLESLLVLYHLRSPVRGCAGNEAYVASRESIHHGEHRGRRDCE